jgi:hypothetical protein
LEKLVPSYAKQLVSFGRVCNFDAENVRVAFTHRGVAIASSFEQSAKAQLLVALAALASMRRRPCVLVVGLVKPGTSELELKMRPSLQALGVKSSFLADDEPAWRKFKANDQQMNEFREGSRLVVIPSYAMARTQFVE